MTAPLDAKTKTLRGMTPAQLADKVGTWKATIAEVDEELEAIKQECIRRGLLKAEGKLFDITLSPPGERTNLDKDSLLDVFGDRFVAKFSKTSVGESWTLRCNARKQHKPALVDQAA